MWRTRRKMSYSERSCTSTVPAPIYPQVNHRIRFGRRLEKAKPSRFDPSKIVQYVSDRFDIRIQSSSLRSRHPQYQQISLSLGTRSLLVKCKIGGQESKSTGVCPTKPSIASPGITQTGYNPSHHSIIT